MTGRNRSPRIRNRLPTWSWRPWGTSPIRCSAACRS